VTIREIQPILWKLSVSKKFMSDDEREYLSEPRYWISVSKEVEHWYVGRSDDDLYEKARLAMYALQVMCPVGGRNVYLKFRETPEGLDNFGSSHPAEMKSTLIGRIAVLDEQTLQTDFDKVYHGINRAFDERIVRLQNPLILLEHGLQIGHVYLSTLVWVMGLDMLFMAGEKLPFVERVAGFLGPNTPVFPTVSFLNRQPRLTVGEVLEDVYELRNIVAHGREIPARPFREKRAIVDTSGERINCDDYFYAQVIMESALFILAKSLRQIMLGDLVDAVKDEAQWKCKLKAEGRLGRARTPPSA
jgi:hypothetical protein